MICSPAASGQTEPLVHPKKTENRKLERKKEREDARWESWSEARTTAADREVEMLCEGFMRH